MSTENKKSVLVPFLIIAGMFFIFGFVTWINGALIPFMKTMCDLSDAESFLVVSASYISFVVMAIPASMVLRKIGYRRGMSLGLILMGLGALVFIPAASSRTYAIFLVGIFIQGAGMTILQTASNPYITILGPIESAARRISIMGICNKVAGALGSIIFGVLLLSGIKEINEKLALFKGAERDAVLDQMADSVVGPYIIMAIALGVLGVLINFAPLPDLNMGEPEEGEDGSSEADYASTKTSVFQFPHLLIGVLALFMYVGVEVAAGDTIIAYGIAMDLEGATRFTSFTLGFMVLTYILGALLIPKVISQKNALIGSAVLGSIFTVCVTMTEGFTSVIFVAMLGIANALVWPAIWPLAINKLGKYTKTGAALLIMAIAGGAVISPLYGVFVGAQKDSMVTEKSDAISLAFNGTDKLLSSFPKTKMLNDSTEIELDTTLLAKVKSASLNLDTASMELSKESISNAEVIKYIKSSNADINNAFDLSVGLNIAKDSLDKLVKIVKKDPDLASGFGTAFINTFTGGLDMAGEFNAWGDKLNKIINSSDKSSVSSSIDELVKLSSDLEIKIEAKAELKNKFNEVINQLNKAKVNLTQLDGEAEILAESAAELGKADALIKPVVAEASTAGYWVLLPCYLIILFFAVKGYKVGLPKED